ncbi:extracellular solute-binding protein [Amnibacterium kyonggiense]|uniref:Carbohydrate ABC transporter substrate-binding protein (CUT1 family) n=1 Tax=Amnibacterium kyonggiense TaxID=595671 RepID=A0A4R7FQD4_9MICO|nr:extracellular solute-binding protein [Amnibacterium kyonggiense]TDS79906.1 carbohydrate ABC transporter substrate-binding protein (CUT1 family) [Amnibacterium kyonggiense]
MHRSRRVRSIAAAAVATALAVGLTACGQGNVANPSLTSKGPITIWYSNNEQEVAWGKQMVASWNRDHPDQKVTAQEIPAGRTSESVISASITAGNAPCLVLNTAPFAAGQFEKQGGLVDLSKFPDGNSYIEGRSGDLAKQYRSSVDGDYYQLPWKSNPVVIFYNKKLFAKAGIDTKDPGLGTYAGFLAAARKVVKSGASKVAIQPAPTSEFFQMDTDFYPLYVAASGGTPLIRDGKATFNDKTGDEVANFWRTLYKEGLSSPEQYQGDAFADGYAAMAIVGPWAVSYYKDVDWGAVPVPTPNGTPTDEIHTFSDAKNIGMYTACPHKGTAWELLKYATSSEQDAKFLDLTGQMPIRPDLASTYADYFAKHPQYALFGSLATRTVEVPAGPNTVQEMQTFRNEWTSSVIFGGKNPAQALDDAAATIDTLEAQP